MIKVKVEVKVKVKTILNLSLSLGLTIMLKAKNIHKSFNSGAKSIGVLKGVDISAGRGEFISIVGPSGAGKSTIVDRLTAVIRKTFCYRSRKM